MIDACRRKGGPVCVGLDPVWERLPRELQRSERFAGAHEEMEAAVASLVSFCVGVLEAVSETVPCVKVQSACFERYHAPGVQAYELVIERALQLGLVVIGDAKRGDIGISAEHYAAGCLADTPIEPARLAQLERLVSSLKRENSEASKAELRAEMFPRGPDALTVNSYLGDDSLRPFLNVAKLDGKGLFALVRTSNPGGDALQGLELKDGRTVAEAVGQMVARLGDEPGCIGASRYSLLGAVVGATKPRDAARLRELMPRQIFLVPGFGAQGGTADDVRACFKPDGTGAIVTASRSVLYAYEKSGESDWKRAIADAAIEMKKQVNAILS